MEVRRGALRLTAGALLLAVGGLPGPAQTSGGIEDRARPIDVGYDWAPRGFAPGGQGGLHTALSFCRFVGDATKPHLKCSFHDISPDLVRFESTAGIDRGYDWGPRAFVDVSGDRLLDFCRLVGDPHAPRLACLLAVDQPDRQDRKFADDQYGFQSAQPFKDGQAWVGSGFGDVNGDRQADFCYLEGPPDTLTIACLFAGPAGFAPPQRRFVNTLQQRSTRADLPWAYRNVDSDGGAEFCHFIDGDRVTLLQCLSETVILGPQTPSLAHPPIGSQALTIGEPGVRVYTRSGLDLGYDWAARGFADADSDGAADYCRFVGDPHGPFIACATKLFADGDQYALHSGPVDVGLPELPRGFLDVDSDSRAEFCRFVQGPSTAVIRCAMARRDIHPATLPDFTDREME